MVHNPEVTGSTPVGGILLIRVLYRSAQCAQRHGSDTHSHSPPFPDPRQAGRKTEQSHNSGVAQRQSIYNIVGRILRPCIKVRKTDGYRLISGRSQDRNLSPEYLTHSRALQKRIRGPTPSSTHPLTPPPPQIHGVKLDVKRSIHNTGVAQRKRVLKHRRSHTSSLHKGPKD